MMNNFAFEMGPIRPPNEAMSLLLRVSRGCPWNRCRFCTSYENDNFETRSVDEVLSDIDNMHSIAVALSNEACGQNISDTHLQALITKGVDRFSAYQVARFLIGGSKNVFLQDADSLSIKPDNLIEILKRLKSKFPEIERITSYARSMTLFKCGVDTLAGFKAAGLTRVHVGLESGSDEVLKNIRKGVIAKHHVLGGQAAICSGLELSEYIMPGIAGANLSQQNAKDTADVLNQINPHYIRLRSFYPLPDSSIGEDVRENKFDVISPDEQVLEILILIKNLKGITSYLASDHNLNLLMELEGQFPDDKEMMIATIESYLSMPDDRRLLFRIGRRLGYFQVLADLKNTAAANTAQLAVDDLVRRFGDADLGLLKIMPVSM